MSTKRYTEDQFIEAVKNNFGMAQTLRAIGLKVTGANYTGAKFKIKKLGLDTGHWLGHGSTRGTKGHKQPQRPLADLLVRDSPCGNTGILKKRLIAHGMLKSQCLECGVTDTYNNKPIVLQMDHINGTHDDNRLENLRILCPNCHSQTSTFTGRQLKKDPKVCVCGVKIGRKSKSCGKSQCRGHNNSQRVLLQTPSQGEGNKSIQKFCMSCNSEVVRGPKCQVCIHKEQLRIDWPDPILLQEEVVRTSYSATGKRLGVSDNAVKHYLKKHGLVVYKHQPRNTKRK